MVERAATVPRDGAAPTEADIRLAIGEVRDPELPIAVTDLGLIREVTVRGSSVRVALVPTFSACPAIEVIRRDIRARVQALPGVEEVAVDLVFDDPWTMARMSPRGRSALAAFGLSLPQSGGEEPAACPYCGSTNTTLENPFGPTLCRAIYYCRDCRNPLERFRPPGE
ncbi:MAG: 1,2-phenylacetyl-CoA epoxidase subunit PaaD [bacterium]